MTKMLKIGILAVSATFALLSLQGCKSFTGGYKAELNVNNSSITDTSSDPVSPSSATTDASTHWGRFPISNVWSRKGYAKSYSY